MTKEQILEGNKIIAEFMMIVYNTEYEGRGIVTTYIFPSDYKKQYSIEDLLFDSDWNWLMDAWVKFKKEAEYTIGIVTILDDIASSICNGDIESTFIQLYKAIQWYNKNK